MMEDGAGALLQGVPSSADDGIRLLVIFEDMCLGNDTSHEILTAISQEIEVEISCTPFEKAALPLFDS